MMLRYQCYDLQASKHKIYAKTSQRWAIVVTNDSRRSLNILEETYPALLMHDNGDHIWFWCTVYGSSKPINKDELPLACQQTFKREIIHT